MTENRLIFFEKLNSGVDQAAGNKGRDTTQMADSLQKDLDRVPEKSADARILHSMSPEEIQGRTWILNDLKITKKDPSYQLHKNESERRVKSYTREHKTPEGKTIYTLQYPNRSQEYGIGLGEIFVDQTITKLKVSSKNGETNVVIRGISKDGRPCFLDSNGQYFATYTGDQIEILEQESEINEKEYLAKLNKEEVTRQKYRQHLETVKQYASNENPIKYHESIDIKDEKLGTIDTQSIESANNEVQTNIGGIDKIKERPNFIKITKYLAQRVGIPASLIIAVAYRESRININIDGDNHTSKGLGHFKKGAWENAKSDPRFAEIMGDFASTEQALQVGRGQSVVADILGLALNLKMSAEKLRIHTSSDKEMTAEELVAMRFHYHVPGYAYQVNRHNLLLNQDGKAETISTPDGASDKLKTAINFYNAKFDRYVAYARQVQAFSLVIS